MAHNLSLGDVLRTRIVCVMDSQVSINVRHWVVSTLTGTFTDLDAATQMDGQINAAYKALMNNVAVYHGVGCQVISAVPMPIEQISNGNTAAGTSGATPLPPQTCGLLSWRSNNAGRAGRGRTYLPFPSSTDNTTDGVPTAGYQTRMNTLSVLLGTARTWTGSGGSVSVTPVIYGRKAHTVTPIVTVRAEPAWATQRRRSLFGRTNVAPF